jgi:hypothetical protein
MRNVLDKSCGENKTTHFIRKSAVCEIRWKNKVEPDRPQMTI